MHPRFMIALPPLLQQTTQMNSGQTRTSPEIAILLCTHQGRQFLESQLDSIQYQSHANWSVYASDDRSTDGTLKVLGAYREKWGDERLSIRPGPCKGFRANFLAVACAQDILGQYFAYCDQDDVWEFDKLDIAVRWLAACRTFDLHHCCPR